MIIAYYFVLGGFMGDIALPNIDYERELSYDKSKLQDEVEKYKQEVLEGLQIEEEGLTAYIRKKTKQSSTLVTQRNYNDPIDNDATAEEIIKKNQKINTQINTRVTKDNDGNGTVTGKGEEQKKIIETTQERLIKTQSNNREIFEGIEVGMLIETTTNSNVKVRHSRRQNTNDKNRRGRKRGRRKNKRKNRYGLIGYLY